jgi:putative N-acetylmannosamine-6-phosphate epimerase
MAGFAGAAVLGGAVGLRVNGAADTRAVRKVTDLPIIGINKLRTDGWPVYITPTVASARAVVRAGADIVAIDATHRARQGGLSPEALIRAIQQDLGCPVMADIDSLAEGLAVAAAGADIVATTMAGYTPARLKTDGPDLDLLRELAQQVQIPVICEGRIRGPEDVVAAFAAGAFAVVVGTAITNPLALTEIFVQATPRAHQEAAIE